jgi:hypothetical protein
MDLERPSVARMYDYFLGGSHNFAVDREAARQIIAAAPEAPVAAQANRAFLRRATRFLVDLGVRQFLDIGSGIPTVGNVHEIAQQLAPQTRVMYVDIDPVAVAHSRQILDGNDLAGVIQEDLRQPDRVLDNPDLRKLIDLGEPVAVMLVAVLHFVPDAANPAGVIAALRRELPPGSYLVLSHASAEGREDQVDSIKSVYERQRVDNSVHPRSRAEVTQMFDGFELVPPGVVWVSEWRPEDPREVTGGYNAGFLCGVGRLRG